MYKQYSKNLIIRTGINQVGVWSLPLCTQLAELSSKQSIGDVLLQPRDLQLGVQDRIFCRIIALSSSMCALQDLLFTVVIIE